MQFNVLIDKEIKEHPRVPWLRKVAKKVLIAQGVDAELDLLITGQAKIRELNRDYRAKDRVTDVLSFTMTPGMDETSPFIAPPDGVKRLGEVIISYPQAVIQAKQRRHAVEKEIAILIIHGALHLLGYDHEKPEERRQMRAREKEILEKIIFADK